MALRYGNQVELLKDEANFSFPLGSAPPGSFFRKSFGQVHAHPRSRGRTSAVSSPPQNIDQRGLFPEPDGPHQRHPFRPP